MKVPSRFLIALQLAWQAAIVLSTNTEVITITDEASLVGTVEDGYESFLGIPYAKPPTGDLRFAAPVYEDAGWEGQLEATETPKPCVQQNIMLPNVFPLLGQEDCLYLNIYRPPKPEDGSEVKAPVLFYIHGGGFFFGSGDPTVVGPAFIMARATTEPVILVVIQYRLSALGFLSTGDDQCPGNAGFKDQRAALKWVYNHISKFGGDPDRITIAGQSAGGASVGLHLLSPMSQPMIHKAIMLSGSAIGPYIYPTKDPLSLARQHAAALNIADADSISTADLMVELRKQEATEIIRTAENLKTFDIDPLTIYRLVLENESTPEPFMVEEPRDILKKGDFKNVPMLFGLVQIEGAVRALGFTTNSELRDKLNANLTGILPEILELNSISGEERDAFVGKIIERYIPGGQLTDENKESFIQMYTDRSFVYPHFVEMEYILAKADVDVASYHFNYRGQYSYSQFYSNMNQDDFGVVHCDDLLYLFKTFPLTEKDVDASTMFVDYVLSHVRGSAEPKTTLSEDSLGPYANFIKTDDGDMEKNSGSYNIRDVVDFWNQAKEF